MRTRWVTFDCFGTLVDWNTGFAAILSPLFGDRTADVLRAYHEIERELEAARPHRLYREVLTTGVALAAARVGRGLSADEAKRLWQLWGSMPVFGDVEEMLAGLRGMGCRLAVLTNCDEDFFRETQRAFRQPFDLVVTAQRVQSYKPASAHFDYFGKSTGVDRENWVHVANSWFHDIVPAKRLGIPHIWLDRDLVGPVADAASVRVLAASEVCSAVARLHASAG